MPRINLKDETCELAIVAAALARVNNENYTDLLQRLIDEMDIQEKHEFRKLYTKLTFGSRRSRCPL